MRKLRPLAILMVLLSLPDAAPADGLIHQLPKDGGWSRFEVKGEAFGADGNLQVTVDGTQTIRSVGRVVVDKEARRWIELESKLTFHRNDGRKAEMTEIIKFLVPEKRLAAGENPRDHVLKAYRGSSATKIEELDLNGAGARQIQSLDEMFHAPLKKTAALPAAKIEVKDKTWNCKGSSGETSTDKGSVKTETRIHNDAPFGVVAYQHTKIRKLSDGKSPTRTMKWKLVDFGTDAKSAAPDAK